MLIKRIVNDPGDYEKTLKLRCALCLALTAVGGVGLVCYFVLVSGSGLPGFVRGFYLGASSGILGAGLVLLLRSAHLLRSPEARKKAQVKEQDERERAIVDGAFRFAGMFTFFAGALALFIVLPLSFPAFIALFCAVAVYAAAFYIGCLYLSKKL